MFRIFGKWAKTIPEYRKFPYLRNEKAAPFYGLPLFHLHLFASD
ncbi:hypothetical protein D068_cds41250 [Bacillus atrophaeus UCMB-5137]|nr:hypothetical protein D068_cds41250 [Bacillus atrophaeus UCMB-5137]